MVLGVREPVEFARQVEEHPRLPAAGCERVSGYGVMGPQRGIFAIWRVIVSQVPAGVPAAVPAMEVAK